MFDITGEDILLLNDEDLRELIGRLSAPCSPFLTQGMTLFGCSAT